jgi:hypothetical protein
MSTRSILLRCLLALALLCNGVASVVAGVHAHADMPAQDIAAAPTENIGHASPCHEPAEAAPMPMVADSDAEPASCCDGGQCDCTCIGTALAPTRIEALAGIALPHTRPGHRLADGHRGPALAHPIRPPIG